MESFKNFAQTTFVLVLLIQKTIDADVMIFIVFNVIMTSQMTRSLLIKNAAS